MSVPPTRVSSPLAYPRPEGQLPGPDHLQGAARLKHHPRAAVVGTGTDAHVRASRLDEFWGITAEQVHVIPHVLVIRVTVAKATMIHTYRPMQQLLWAAIVSCVQLGKQVCLFLVAKAHAASMNDCSTMLLQCSTAHVKTLPRVVHETKVILQHGQHKTMPLNQQLNATIGLWA